MACIRINDSGRFTVDFRVVGRRRRQTFDTKAEARAFVRDLAMRPVDKMTGFRKAKQASVTELVRSYLSTVTTMKSPATQVLEKEIFERFLKSFAIDEVDSMSLKMIEEYQSNLRKTLAAETVNRHFNSIRHFFNKCVDWEYLSASPCARLKKLKNDRLRTVRTFTGEQVDELLALAQPWLADAIFFMVKTAVRRKELVFLKWGSVDLQRRCFHIESSEGFHPKGYKPRTLPLTEEIHLFLTKKRDAAAAIRRDRDTDRVFLNSVANPIHPKALTKEMQRLRIKLGWERLGPHALRHTALTNLAMRGVSSSIIQKVAGHSDGRMTERYVHLGSVDLLVGLEKLSS